MLKSELDQKTDKYTRNVEVCSVPIAALTLISVSITITSSNPAANDLQVQSLSETLPALNDTLIVRGTMRSVRVFCVSVLLAGSTFTASAFSKGDLTKQEPIVVSVELGTSAGNHVFAPNHLTLETGNLYKLVLVNPSQTKHYFTSHGLAKSVFTRKVQVVDQGGTKAEIKGTISEIEVYPGGHAEWWFVPVSTGMFSDLHCHIKDTDGQTHAHKGMTGTIEIK
ncbi:MAG: hypothetical protein VX871_07220 [Pseudomonadota bacterium]|nr:hypothetical protein [Pseudomonadota bacterium]